ncbi:MAG: hypothetical protein P4L50_07820, partial [Anaerolineaceae bacterium]|nr:hypothetical protein [Anaerolineaceae bacterium]
MMGFVLSILYLVIYYLTPAYLLGPLADAHIEVIIAALVILVSVPALMKSFLWKNSQSLALIGLAIAVFLSVVIESHWVGGGVQALLNFIPNCMAFFMVSLHVTTKRRVKIVILMLLAVCLINIAHGVTDLRRGIAQNNSTPYRDDGSQARLGATASPYLLQQQNDSGEITYRVQGLGEINDPNDFGQLMVCLIPLLFIFWRQNKTIKNIMFVFLP